MLTKHGIQVWWRKWTIDRPADFGDWLWQTFVVDFANFLNDLTFFQAIRLFAIFLLVAAFSLSLPIELSILLAGDTIMYIELATIAALLSASVRVLTFLRYIAETFRRAVSPSAATIRRYAFTFRASRSRRRKRLSLTSRRQEEPKDGRPAFGWGGAAAYA
ncbi:MAG TPA: hypothetical protein PKA55_04505 [Rhodoblastus sp.]|nr:hypothetical protein [Rhodoblastus sp.]